MSAQARPTSGAGRTVLPARRREAMVALVQQAGQATVTELADNFRVSHDTARRDIDALAEAGLLTRTHGGAIPAASVLAAADVAFEHRVNEHKEVKRAIARAAAPLIQNGETVIINGGTTTLAVAAALGGHRDLTIVTNNILLPQTVNPRAVRDILVVGGSVRVNSMTTTGPVKFPAQDGRASHAVVADAAIIGVGGITVARGLSTSYLPDAQMIREMINVSARLIVVADSRKVGHDALAEICALNKVDQLVCDISPDDPVARDVIESGGTLVSLAAR